MGLHHVEIYMFTRPLHKCFLCIRHFSRDLYISGPWEALGMSLGLGTTPSTPHQLHCKNSSFFIRDNIIHKAIELMFPAL